LLEKIYIPSSSPNPIAYYETENKIKYKSWRSIKDQSKKQNVTSSY